MDTTIKKKFCFETIAVAIFTFLGGSLTPVALILNLYVIYKIKKNNLSGKWFALSMLTLNTTRIILFLGIMISQ